MPDFVDSSWEALPFPRSGLGVSWWKVRGVGEGEQCFVCKMNKNLNKKEVDERLLLKV